jgi:predicted component of type VI protein secretion system
MKVYNVDKRAAQYKVEMPFSRLSMADKTEINE